MEQSNKTIDAFLSHNSKDKPMVKEIGRYLEEKAGLTVFLDEWDLIPGEPWQEDLERALSESRTCVCFIGEGEPTPWQNEEMRAALNEMVTKGSIRVVPVLLPGAKRQEKESGLPMFLRRLAWVEFKKTWNEPDMLYRLVCGIKGIRPGIGKTAHDKAPVDQIRCPFRGLEVFREKDREFFFGREAVVQRLMEKLNRSRFLAIVGPSGVGKSSIVQAGLIPLLRSDSLAALFTPRMYPIEELAFALYLGCMHDGVEVKTPVEEWIRRFKGSSDALHFIAREVIEGLKLKDKKRLILVVDQFEELFTQTRSEDEKRRFIAMVLYAVEKMGGPVTVIVTMRSDFLGKCAYYPDLNVHVTDYLEQIEPMSTDELRAAVEEPALAVGLEFEKGLVDRVLEDAGGGAGELPLVEHALLELFENRQDRFLTMGTYNGIGGISGALAQRAKGEYEKLSDKEKEILRNMFVLRLVQPGEGTEDTRRRAIKEELLAVGGDREAAEKVLKKWTDARLLTVMHDRVRGQDMVDVAHESLIRKWERIRQWMAEGREISRQVGILRQAAWEWDRSMKNPDFLYRGARLAQLEGVMDSHSVDLTEIEKKFIWAGVARRESDQKKEIERREELLRARTRIIHRSRVILAVVLIAFVGMAFLFYQSNRNKNNTLKQLAMNYRDNGSMAREKGDSLRALHWLAEAVLLTPDPVSRNNYLLDMNGLWKEDLLHIFNHKGGIRGAVLNKDETKILTWGGKTAQLWDIGTGKQIGPSMTHNAYVNGAVFNHDETEILTWSDDKTARLWDLTPLPILYPPMEHDGPVNGAMFNHDETKILTWSDDKTARLWEAGTDNFIGPPMIHDNEVKGALFNKDETKILTWGDKTALVWEAGTGIQIGEPMQHETLVKGAVFNRDGTKILTWCGILAERGSVRLWEAGTSKPIGKPMTHYNLLNGARFNSDETKILSWSWDGTAQLWETGTGKPIGETIHDIPLDGAVFNRDETKILTWGGKSVRLWMASTGIPISPPMIHDRPVKGAVFNSDETKILTWDGDYMSKNGSVRLWDAETGKPIVATMTHDYEVNGAVFNRNETNILTWSSDYTARLWTMIKKDKTIVMPMTQDTLVKGTMFNRDETKILTWGNKTARLWEARTGNLIGKSMQHSDRLISAIFNRDETKILTWGDKTAQIWEAGTGIPIGPPMKHDSNATGAVFTRDRTKVLTWSSNYLSNLGSARLWEAEIAIPIGPPMAKDGFIQGAIFNRDETRILTWGNKTARLWEVMTGKSIGPPIKCPYSLKGAMFNRDETKILTWSPSPIALMWEVSTGKPIAPLMKHYGSVMGAVFNHDETKILTWSADSTAQLWNIETNKTIGPPLKHDGTIMRAKFNQAENLILTCSWDETARLWEVGTGKPIGEPMKHYGFVKDAVFNRDETKILTWDRKYARLWDIDVDYDFPLDLLKLQIAALTGTEFNPTTSEITFIEPERWEKMKAEYLEKAAKHYKSCKYKNANIFHRFYPNWPKK